MAGSTPIRELDVSHLPFLCIDFYVEIDCFYPSLIPANFSEPEIEEAQNETRNTGINLTCSSKQGYPKPTKMYFLITNSTNEYGDNMQISQDNVTKLFSVSVSLSLSFPDEVYNMTIVCILETESMNISSKPHNMGKAAS